MKMFITAVSISLFTMCFSNVHAMKNDAIDVDYEKLNNQLKSAPSDIRKVILSYIIDEQIETDEEFKQRLSKIKMGNKAQGTSAYYTIEGNKKSDSVCFSDENGCEIVKIYNNGEKASVISNTYCESLAFSPNLKHVVIDTSHSDFTPYGATRYMSNIRIMEFLKHHVMGYPFEDQYEQFPIKILLCSISNDSTRIALLRNIHGELIISFFDMDEKKSSFFGKELCFKKEIILDGKTVNPFFSYGIENDIKIQSMGFNKQGTAIGICYQDDREETAEYMSTRCSISRVGNEVSHTFFLLIPFSCLHKKILDLKDADAYLEHILKPR